MAKKNDGPKKVINPERMGGTPDKRTPKEMHKDGPKKETKKQDEMWVQQAERTKKEVAKEPSFREKIDKERISSKPLTKTEPDKDK